MVNAVFLIDNVKAPLPSLDPREPRLVLLLRAGGDWGRHPRVGLESIAGGGGKCVAVLRNELAARGLIALDLIGGRAAEHRHRDNVVIVERCLQLLGHRAVPLGALVGVAGRAEGGLGAACWGGVGEDVVVAVLPSLAHAASFRDAADRLCCGEGGGKGLAGCLIRLQIISP